MFRKKIITVASVGVGCFLAGLSTERWSYSLKENEKITKNLFWKEDSTRQIPGLPFFGTVSAASLIPSKSGFNEPRGIPPEPSLGAPRVSQVLMNDCK